MADSDHDDKVPGDPPSRRGANWLFGTDGRRVTGVTIIMFTMLALILLWVTVRGLLGY